jgi:TonB family protein
MNPRRLPLILRFCAGVLLISLAEVSVAQTGTGSTAQENGVVLTNLYPPAYPAIAKAARVAGDVKLQIKVSRDGTVSSIKVVSGPPLLEQAALESAQKSTFVCESCTNDATAYSLTYSFLLRENVDCSARRIRSVKCAYIWRCGGWRSNEVSRPIRIEQSQDHIKVVADAMCVEAEYSDLAKN